MTNSDTSPANSATDHPTIKHINIQIKAIWDQHMLEPGLEDLQRRFNAECDRANPTAE